MIINFNSFSPVTVEVINRQQKVEYNVISGIADEKEVRAFLGNVGRRDTYDYCFTGHYSDRKPAISRLKEQIKELEKEIEYIKFALKVTKKKNWSKVINKDNK